MGATEALSRNMKHLSPVQDKATLTRKKTPRSNFARAHNFFNQIKAGNAKKKKPLSKSGDNSLFTITNMVSYKQKAGSKSPKELDFTGVDTLGKAKRALLANVKLPDMDWRDVQSDSEDSVPDMNWEDIESDPGDFLPLDTKTSDNSKLTSL